MKFFTNKSIWSKIIILLIFVILFQFAAVKPSYGADDVLEFGGKLLTPILSLVVTLGDGIIGIAHSAIMGVEESLIKIDLSSSFWEIFGYVVIAILAAVAIVLVCVFTAGLSAIISGIAMVVKVRTCINSYLVWSCKFNRSR